MTSVFCSSRYILESDVQVRTILEDGLPQTNALQDSRAVDSDMHLSWLPKIIKDFVLPAGFPGCIPFLIVLVIFDIKDCTIW